MRVKFSVLEQTQGLHLHAKFYLNVFIVSASGGQKPQFLANFDFWGLLYPCNDDIQIWCPYVPSVGLFCRPLAAKNHNFCSFLDFGLEWCRQLHGSSLRTLNTGAQLQTFHYPTVSKSFLYSNDFMAKSGAQTLTFKSVTDRQTDKQNTHRFWPPRRRVKSEPHQTWHGDRGPRARSCASKTFGDLMHSFAARRR